MNHIRTRMEARRERADDAATLWAAGFVGSIAALVWIIF